MFYLFHNVIQCLIHTPSVNRCVPPEQHISFPFLSVGSVFPLFMRFLHLTPTSPQRQADSSKLPIPTRVPTATHSHAIPPSSPHSLPNLSLDPVPHCTGCPSQLPGERIASLCLLYPRMCQGTVRTTNNISPPPVFWHILMHGALSSPLLVRTPNSGFALLHECFFCRVVAVTHC